MTDLCFLSIAEASRMIAARKLSPIELTQAFLDRIEEYDPALNAYLLVLRENAIADAHAAEAEIARGEYRGPLHGIPIALKDIYCTDGVRTTAHSAVLKDYVPDEDAFSVALLKRAGAIILGKTSTWEFAIGGPSFDLPWPPARNPWNTAHDPGGSSSGSAAAVAAGLAMAAMGSDTGGSIRGPSALCGLAGIKPTYGLVSRRGILPLSFSLDHAGPLCWTAEDCALMMNVLAAHDPGDPASANVPKPDFGSTNKSISGLRIGVARQMAEEAGTEAVVMGALENALQALHDLGAQICDVNLAPSVEYADVAALIARAESYAIHETNLIETPEAFGSIFRQRIAPGALIRGCDYVNAMRERTRLVSELARVMEKVDLVITPGWPTPAPILGAGPGMSRERGSFARPFNVTGAPALSVCSGFWSDGLPLSVQFAGRPFEDHIVLRAGRALEDVLGLRDRRPLLDSPVTATAA